MSYRVRRKFTSTKFCVDNHVCKIFFNPQNVYHKNFYLWNVALVAGKSNRQLNDWYKMKKNKRARSLQGKVVGRAGLRIIQRAYEKIFGELRWLIEPGDCFVIDCSTSGKPDKEFRAFWRWLRRHSDMGYDYEKKIYFWYRPPYPHDNIYKNFKVFPVTPENPIECISGSRYFDCFRVEPKVQDTDLSMEQITDLLSPVLTTGPYVEKPI